VADDDRRARQRADDRLVVVGDLLGAELLDRARVGVERLDLDLEAGSR
jgi:hypothetical protein